MRQARWERFDCADFQFLMIYCSWLNYSKSENTHSHGGYDFHRRNEAKPPRTPVKKGEIAGGTGKVRMRLQK